MIHNLEWMTARPIAHRGFHNAKAYVFENTLSACQAAIDHNYNIEVDLHPASDGTPMVFHDLTLERLVGSEKSIRQLESYELSKLRVGGGKDHIANLNELLEMTDGKTGLVLEMKGLNGEDQGFVSALAECLKNYQGPVAIMSFYHWLLNDAREFAPHLPLGLTALGDETNFKLHKSIAELCNFDFLSYKWKDLPCTFAKQFSASGKPVICWTAKTPAQMAMAQELCDQVTFEGFDPDKS